jgi:hypothetical protein
MLAEIEVRFDNARLGDIGISVGRGEAVLRKVSGVSGSLMWEAGSIMWWTDKDGRWWNDGKPDADRDIVRIVRRAAGF